MLEDHGGGRKARVCVDGRLLAAEATGVATYARTLVAALRATGAPPLILQDADGGRFASPQGRATRWRRWLEARRPGAVRVREDRDGFHARDIFRLAQARFNATGRLLDLIAPGPPGIMHWTYPVPARVAGWANVYTVHDVIPLTDPELADTDAAALRARLDALLAAGGRFVTVSEHSRQEIARLLHRSPATIIDCGLAVEPLEGGDRTLPAGLHPGYFLFCGSSEPRKNLPRVVAAWRASGSTRPLVLAGHAPTGGHGGGVIELGFVSRGILVALLAQARALVFPTLAEGFGLPIVEAMALGTPVVTADRGAVAAVAGGAALTVNPLDVRDIAAAIRRLHHDNSLHAELSARGAARARNFSLDAFGRRLRAAYAEITGDLPHAT